MIVFDVYRNGKRLCRAGGEDLAVLSVILSAGPFARRPSARTRRRSARPRPLAIHLDVRGLVPLRGGASHHPGWVFDWLKVGDEIRVKIVRSERVDLPTRQTSYSAAERRRDERAFYEQMKRKFERKR